MENCNSSVVVVLDPVKLFTDCLCRWFWALKNPSCWDKLPARASGCHGGDATLAAAAEPGLHNGSLVELVLDPLAGRLHHFCLGEVGCRGEFHLGFPSAWRMKDVGGSAGRWWALKRRCGLIRGDTRSSSWTPLCLVIRVLGKLPSVVKLQFLRLDEIPQLLSKQNNCQMEFLLILLLLGQLRWHLKLMCCDCTSQCLWDIQLYVASVLLYEQKYDSFIFWNGFLSENLFLFCFDSAKLFFTTPTSYHK